MAEHASEYTHGEMDIRQNVASFHVFVLMAKWGSLAVAVGVLFFALLFCTQTGFVGSAIPALVVLVLGVLLLRDKRGSAHA